MTAARIADHAHVVDALDQLDSTDRRHRTASRSAYLSGNISSSAGAGEHRDAAAVRRRRSLAISRVVPKLRIRRYGIGRGQIFAEFGGTAKASVGSIRSSRCRAGAARRARGSAECRRSPSRRIRPVGRRVIAEIGREQHGAHEQFWIGVPATRSAKPPPAEKPTSVSGSARRGLADLADDIDRSSSSWPR